MSAPAFLVAATSPAPSLATQSSVSPGHSVRPGQLWLALHELNWELECHTDAPSSPHPHGNINLSREEGTNRPAPLRVSKRLV